jgi:hypothetical protein
VLQASELVTCIATSYAPVWQASVGLSIDSASSLRSWWTTRAEGLRYGSEGSMINTRGAQMVQVSRGAVGQVLQNLAYPSHKLCQRLPPSMAATSKCTLAREALVLGVAEFSQILRPAVVVDAVIYYSLVAAMHVEARVTELIPYKNGRDTVGCSSDRFDQRKKPRAWSHRCGGCTEFSSSRIPATVLLLTNIGFLKISIHK